MRRRTFVLPLASAVALAALAGCGSSNETELPGPPHDAGGKDSTAQDGSAEGGGLLGDGGAHVDGSVDAGSDAETAEAGDDAGELQDGPSGDAAEDAHTEGGGQDGSVGDAGHDASAEGGGSGGEAGADAGHDASVEAGTDAAAEAGQDAAVEASLDAGTDAPTDAGANGGEVWVVRVGASGGAALTSAAAAAFIDRFAIAGGAALGTITLPVIASGVDQPLTISGTATSEGALSRSGDGKSVVLAGYAAAPGAGDTHADGAVTGIKDTPTTGTGAVLRVLGSVDASHVATTSFTTTAYSGSNIRGATTTDGTAYWMAGDTPGGVSYQAASAGTPVLLSTGLTTVRVVDVFDGRVYATASTGAFRGVFSMTAALPVAADTPTILPGFPITTGPSSYGMAALALGNTADIDTFYVCDDNTSAKGGGVQRWKLAAGTWTLSTTFNDSMTAGCRGITSTVSGTSVTLLVTTTEESANRLLELVDTTAGLTTTTATVLATAPANTVFRGVALAPN